MRRLAFVGLALVCAGCVTTESVRFQAKQNQQAMVRDGRPALVSRKPNSLVLIGPAAREMQAGQRPVFVVGLNNLGSKPFDFRISDIQVTQVVNGQATPLRVITYEDLVREERTRQVIGAIVAGAAAGANAYNASQAGYYRSNSTVYGPGGRTYSVTTAGYSPTAAAIAQSRAAAQNDAMIAATVERGQANMAALEQGVMKDNTLMPGEWYGGQLHLQPLVSNGSEQKTYVISLAIGSERHDVEIVQSPDR